MRTGLTALALASCTAIAAAGTCEGRDGSDSWGTQSPIIQAIPAAALVKANSGGAVLIYPDVACDTALCQLYAPLHLPTGALVTRIDVVGCDPSPNDALKVKLGICGPTQPCSPQVIIDTGDAAQPGCQTFEASGGLNFTVDNANAIYLLHVEMGSSGLSARALRVHYKLQVSQPPAMATFQDVPPTHPFFRFVEAVVAAGITGGCSNNPPLFCPDQPVTRGQLAVFLASALGMHWPN